LGNNLVTWVAPIQSWLLSGARCNSSTRSALDVSHVTTVKHWRPPSIHTLQGALPKQSQSPQPHHFRQALSCDFHSRGERHLPPPAGTCGPRARPTQSSLEGKVHIQGPSAAGTSTATHRPSKLRVKVQHLARAAQPQHTHLIERVRETCRTRTMHTTRRQRNIVGDKTYGRRTNPHCQGQGT
jgi:hypothetical protein